MSQNTGANSREVAATWEQVAAFRLERHHLVKRAPTSDLITVVGDMAGAQAQLLSAAQISLWARIQDLCMTDIDAALGNRTLVKAACMRQTLFVVPSEQLAVFIRGSARRAEKEIRWTLRKGVPERIINAAIDATLNTLDQPLTRLEIAERVCHKLGVQKKAVHGGGWGSRRKVAAIPVGDIVFPVVDLLHLVAARGVVCSGLNRGNEPTFVRADAWIPHWQDLPQEEAESTLLRLYLHAFGPATDRDFAAWVGITLAEARRIWVLEQPGLVSVNVEGWRVEILRDDLDKLMRARFEKTAVSLLPYFDTFLLGHKERNHLVAEEYHQSVYRPQGWIAPVALVNGRVVATWKYVHKGDHLFVEVSKFGEISPEVGTGIEEETKALARFLGASDVDVRYIKQFSI